VTLLQFYVIIEMDFKKEVLKEFKRQFKLKKFGSKKIGCNKNVLLILTNDLLQGIELQYDTPREKFTFNLYIRPLFIDVNAPYISPGNRISEFINRVNGIEESSDDWYDVKDYASISSLMSEIYRLFDRTVFPYLESNDSCSKIVENYLMDKFNHLRWSSRLSELHDMAYVAAKCSDVNLFNTYCDQYITLEQHQIESAPTYWPQEMFDRKQKQMDAIIELKKYINTNKSDCIQLFFKKNIQKALKMYKVPLSLANKAYAKDSI
jgi:hypothetical protein